MKTRFILKSYSLALTIAFVISSCALSLPDKTQKDTTGQTTGSLSLSAVVGADENITLAAIDTNKIVGASDFYVKVADSKGVDVSNGWQSFNPKVAQDLYATEGTGPSYTVSVKAKYNGKDVTADAKVTVAPGAAMIPAFDQSGASSFLAIKNETQNYYSISRPFLRLATPPIILAEQTSKADSFLYYNDADFDIVKVTKSADAFQDEVIQQPVLSDDAESFRNIITVPQLKDNILSYVSEDSDSLEQFLSTIDLTDASLSVTDIGSVGSASLDNTVLTVPLAKDTFMLALEVPDPSSSGGVVVIGQTGKGTGGGLHVLVNLPSIIVKKDAVTRNLVWSQETIAAEGYVDAPLLKDLTGALKVGDYVYAVATDPGSYMNIFKINSAGEVTNVTKYTDENLSITAPLFEVAGKIYFAAENSSGYNVYKMDTKNNDAVTVAFAPAEADGHVNSLAILSATSDGLLIQEAVGNVIRIGSLGSGNIIVYKFSSGKATIVMQDISFDIAKYLGVIGSSAYYMLYDGSYDVTSVYKIDLSKASRSIFKNFPGSYDDIAVLQVNKNRIYVDTDMYSQYYDDGDIDYNMTYTITPFGYREMPQFGAASVAQDMQAIWQTMTANDANINENMDPLAMAQ